MNNYLTYIDDEHLFSYIGNLYSAYLKAKKGITKNKFYKNKVDTFKLTFDSKFNNLKEEDLIKLEVSRQIDKSVNNAIGTFHEEILGGIEGFEVGRFSGFDIKAKDNTLFADIKNKHNTMNSSSSESLFQKLARYADDFKDANCYWVQILATRSFNKKWFSVINGKEYSHSRVYRISGDQFYSLLTGRDHALMELYKVLPIAIDDFLNTVNNNSEQKDTLLADISESARKSQITILDEITFENFYYYRGFKDLK